MTRRTALTPLGAVERGLAAGVLGTAAMTACQTLASKLRSRGGDTSGDAGDSPPDPWEQAPAPAKVARRVIEGVLDRAAPADWIPALTRGMHWGYGTAWGAAYGLVQGTRRRRPLATGLVFGTGVWAFSYLTMVPLGIYEPPWKYPPKELALDLSYHFAYGSGLAAGYAALARASD